MEKDKDYITIEEAYMNLDYDNTGDERVKANVMQTFEGIPHFREINLTNVSEVRIYEIRNYGSSTAKLVQNKVNIFTKGNLTPSFLTKKW